MGNLKESCGVFGVYNLPGAVEKTYLGLYALQHRGEESAGIASVQNGRINHHKGMGLVADVFTKDILDRLQSQAAIGHVRYSTTGSSKLVNAQPLVVDYRGGMLAIAHNGNLVNGAELRKQFEDQGSIFQTTTDSEVILHILAKPNMTKENAFIDALNVVRGAYSLLFLTPDELIAARDPQGFRPLCLGRLGKGYAVASETCALDLAGFEHVRDIEPGEILRIGANGIRSEWIVPRKSASPAFCIFEHIYFARPDSKINNDNVHIVRRKLGALLAREHPVSADVVISIPDSGNSAAVGFAEASGIPYDRGFIRNHYVGRTFIQPTQDRRNSGVEIKLNVVKEVVNGRRVVVVDDSIVRGTTSQSRVKRLREAGAKEVHMRISCPPISNPCYYGIDFPNKQELIASGMDVEAIKKHIGLDSLGYLSLQGLLSAVSNPPGHHCTACFSGRYPVAVENGLDKYAHERR